MRRFAPGSPSGFRCEGAAACSNRVHIRSITRKALIECARFCCLLPGNNEYDIAIYTETSQALVVSHFCRWPSRRMPVAQRASRPHRTARCASTRAGLVGVVPSGGGGAIAARDSVHCGGYRNRGKSRKIAVARGSLVCRARVVTRVSLTAWTALSRGSGFRVSALIVAPLHAYPQFMLVVSSCAAAHFSQFGSPPHCRWGVVVAIWCHRAQWLFVTSQLDHMLFVPLLLRSMSFGEPGGRQGPFWSPLPWLALSQWPRALS